MTQQQKDTTPSLSFYLLKSIISSGKNSFEMKSPTESFSISAKSDRPYIEPTLKQIANDHKTKPKVILISAVGATGKTELAKSLSSQLNLPLLDLAKHKPVGD